MHPGVVGIAMPETAKPKIFRELINLYNTIPRGRRIAGYVFGIGFFVFLIALALASYFRTGFLSYLIIAFLIFVSSMHSNYALAQNLTQRKVRKIDYWYVGAAAIGLLLFAAGYSNQRELVVTKLFVAAHHAGEEPIRENVVAAAENLTKWLCNSERPPPFKPACEGIKRFAKEIKPNLTANQIKALDDKFSKTVVLPYGLMFSREQLNKDPSLFSPLSVVAVSLNNWEEYVRSAPSQSASPLDEEAEMLFGVGRLVIWPFFLAYALALRITKVTVDVFEWAK